MRPTFLFFSIIPSRVFSFPDGVPGIGVVRYPPIISEVFFFEIFLLFWIRCIAPFLLAEVRRLPCPVGAFSQESPSPTSILEIFFYHLVNRFSIFTSRLGNRLAFSCGNMPFSLFEDSGHAAPGFFSPLSTGSIFCTSTFSFFHFSLRLITVSFPFQRQSKPPESEAVDLLGFFF